MDIKRRDFLAAGALAFAAAGLPRAVRGACSAGSCCAGSFKTVLKKEGINNAEAATMTEFMGTPEK